MKKVLKILISVLLVFSMVMNISATSDDYNIEISAKVGSNEILSGKTNYLEIAYKATGSRSVFNNSKIIITPSIEGIIEYDIDSLDLYSGLLYDSYSIENSVLILESSVMETGKYFEVPIQFSTFNGLVKDKTEIDFDVQFTSDELSKNSIKTEKMIINASSPLKVNKKYLGFDLDEKESRGKFWGSTTFWTTKALIDYKEEGQEFIQENSKIKVIETYDENLKYVGMEKGDQPVVDILNRTLTWEYDAPSYLEQKTSISTLWSKDYVVQYTTNESTNTDEVLKDVGVNVYMEFTNISGELINDTDYVSVAIHPSLDDAPIVLGEWIHFGTYSPSDGKGNFSYINDTMADIATVYPDGTLTYGHRFSSMASGNRTGYDNYIISYYIDDYLTLKSLRTPGEWIYFPNITIGKHPLEVYPDYTLQFLSKKVDISADGDFSIKPEDLIMELTLNENFNHGDSIDMVKEFSKRGIDINTQVAQVRYNFTNTPAGIFAEAGVEGENMATYTFDINADWKESSKYNDNDNTTSLTNEMTIYGKPTKRDDVSNVTYSDFWDLRSDTINEINTCKNEAGEEKSGIWYGNGYTASCMYLKRNSSDVEMYGYVGDSYGFWDIEGPRTAKVTDAPADYIPTLNNSIKLEKTLGKEIMHGDNTLIVNVDNVVNSVGAINEGGFDSYILVPDSIDLDLENAVAKDNHNRDINYSIEKMTINMKDKNVYKIKWLIDSNFKQEPGYGVKLNVPSNVSDKFKQVNMHVQSYFPNNDEYHILSVEDPKITDTIRVKDLLKLTGKEGNDLIQASNIYTLISDYYLLTKKYVKGSLDDSFSLSGETLINGDIEYKLDFTNKEGVRISKLSLLDVLPSLNDLGITDYVARGSQFNVVLKEPVSVDERFTVLYSTSKNPSRVKLNENLNTVGFDPIDDTLSENVEWLSEDKVSSWESISSFMIILNDQEYIDVDENFSFTFKAVIDQSNYDFNKNNSTDLVAWNSFAINTNENPTVEPERVAIKVSSEINNIVPEDPNIQEELEDPQTPSTGVKQRNFFITAIIGLLTLMIVKKKSRIV